MSRKTRQKNISNLAPLAEPASWCSVMGAIMSGNVPPDAAAIVVVVAAAALFARALGIGWRRKP